ncbi:MAG TPA: chemotaxis protein CheW [Methanospirillum sp.]|jgi:purine-binding chemotaxis protein CheW|uniref:chemotaxis protein CheW n=1 Tax=Methanospirillum sp. TaxID=45200 RepID=UPI0009D1C8E2|nr:chemotaxis protein CheW [Methanospirillum sp.]NLL11357.1 purine-binding chemotaxis protein CheW [Methanomicrobiales archaeon]OQB37906.1 MAG: purine-binding chemotaxis protein [Euryarchaeota archaeon ADurb.Bin165]HPY60192.1 chemotaxis protein CheW [Methanospirillum sp.]
MVVEILEFDLGGESYAMDIGIAREIVEMLPITPIPRAPSHVTGLLNLRGEITTIIDLHHLLGITPSKERDEQKIMVLVPDMFENTSVGVIVDEVRSVLTIDESSVDTNIKGVDENLSDYVQGIIKLGEDDLLKTEISSEGHEAEKRLIIWVDVKKILTGTTET